MAFRIKIAKELDTQLLGRLSGKRHFAEVCRLLAEVPQGDAVLLDFQGVSHVTASWVNTMIGELYRWCAQKGNDLFPLLCNVRDEWLDEFQLVADWTHQCYLLALAPEQPCEGARLIGSLDTGQGECLDAVIEQGETTGAALERTRAQPNIRATAWNNRLRDLHRKRLLRRRRSGRERWYAPIVKKVVRDG